MFNDLNRIKTLEIEVSRLDRRIKDAQKMIDDMIAQRKEDSDWNNQIHRDLFEAIKIRTGMIHDFLGVEIEDVKASKKLVKIKPAK